MEASAFGPLYNLEGRPVPAQSGAVQDAKRAAAGAGPGRCRRPGPRPGGAAAALGDCQGDVTGGAASQASGHTTCPAQCFKHKPFDVLKTPARLCDV